MSKQTEETRLVHLIKQRDNARLLRDNTSQNAIEKSIALALWEIAITLELAVNHAH